MADEKNSLSKYIEEIVKAAEARKDDPKWQATLDALNNLYEKPLPPIPDHLVSTPSSFINREKAIQWLEIHWIKSRRNCPICTHVKWGIGDNVVWLMTGAQSSAYPSIVVLCNNCGYTMLLSASKMNAWPR